MSEKIGK
jgi:hypothetical protein